MWTGTLTKANCLPSENEYFLGGLGAYSVSHSQYVTICILNLHVFAPTATPTTVCAYWTRYVIPTAKGVDMDSILVH